MLSVIVVFIAILSATLRYVVMLSVITLSVC